MPHIGQYAALREPVFGELEKVAGEGEDHEMVEQNQSLE